MTGSSYYVMEGRSRRSLRGDRRVHEITSEQLQDLHVAMAETPFAANRVLALLSKAFNLAELWGWRGRGSNPTRGIQRYPTASSARECPRAAAEALGKHLQQLTSGTMKDSTAERCS